MKHGWCIADLGFGDSGKGSLVNYITNKWGVSLVVRYNGGPQCAHNVVEQGRHHTFAQIGSGFLSNPKQITYLSKYMLVNPFNLIAEAKGLAEICGIQDYRTILDQVYIDGDAVIITPYHIALNRYQEIFRGASAHGSCGQGVGTAREMSIHSPDRILRATDLLSRRRVLEALEFIKETCKNSVIAMGDPSQDIDSKRLASEFVNIEQDPYELVDQYLDADVGISGEDYIKELLDDHDYVIFEGAQGVPLDENNTKYTPHITWTDTTYKNADLIIGCSCLNVEYMGVMRAYMTRHGNGPLPTENPDLTYPEPHNPTGVYQGHFRLGELDLGVIKESINTLGGHDKVDTIVINHMDLIIKNENAVTQVDRNFTFTFKSLMNPLEQAEFVNRIEERLGVPVRLLGFGPESSQKMEWSSTLHAKKVNQTKLQEMMNASQIL